MIWFVLFRIDGEGIRAWRLGGRWYSLDMGMGMGLAMYKCIIYHNINTSRC